MQIDTLFLTQTLSELVSINSINPALSEEGTGESAVGRAAAKVMRSLGLETHVDELAPGRVNVVGIRRGRSRGAQGLPGRSLLWNAHMDTVGVNGMPQPFEPRVESGRLYGRGSQDMKGSLAAMLAAVKALNDAGIELQGDLIVAGVADEEWASLGSEDLVQRYTADAAIVTEPTDLHIATAHRGFVAFEITVSGRAAHGSRYQDGIDAIVQMGAFLHEFAGLERQLLERPPHPLVGPPSIHASTIHGGTEMSTYPAECALVVERRTCPGESVAQAAAELQALLDRCAAADPEFKGSLRHIISRPPFELGAGGDLLRITQDALREHTGRSTAPVGASFWTDAAILAGAGIPSLLLGPVGAGLHSAEEWVDLDSCAGLASVLAAVALDFCGRAA